MLRAAGFLVYRRLNEKIQYLLMQTSYGRHHWTPPKGHLDEGESDREAAIRETEEEAGLKLDDLDVHWNFQKELNYRAKGENKCVVYWLARLKDPSTPVRLSDEHQDFKWVSNDEASKYISEYADLRALLVEAEKMLQTKEL